MELECHTGNTSSGRVLNLTNQADAAARQLVSCMVERARKAASSAHDSQWRIPPRRITPYSPDAEDMDRSIEGEFPRQHRFLNSLVRCLSVVETGVFWTKSWCSGHTAYEDLSRVRWELSIV